MSLVNIQSGIGSKEALAAFLFANITSNATTVIKDSAGMLYGITINKAGTSSTATVFDGTTGSGVKLGVLDTTVVGTVGYSTWMRTSITTVTSGSSAADITVIYV